MTILQLIASDNFIAVNKDLVKIFGLEEAIMLGELASEHSYWKKENKLVDGFFYTTIENVEDHTTLSAHKQRKALKKLQDEKIITIKIMGIPAKRYININEEQLINIFNNKLLKNLTTGCEKNEQLDVKNFNGNNNIINNNINNKIENNINKKEKKESEFDKLINDKIQNDELKDTIYEFIKMRKAIKKPLTTRGLELMINKLNKLSNDTNEQIEILNQSIMNNWQGIFALNEQAKKEFLKDHKKEKQLYKTYDFSKLSPEDYGRLMKKKVTAEQLEQEGKLIAEYI